MSLNRISLLSPAGGFVVMSSDCAEKHGFVFPPLSKETQKAIEAKLRAGVIRVSNPVDLGDAFGTDTMLLTLDKTLAQKNIDGSIVVSARRPLSHYKGPFKTMMRNPVPEIPPIIKKHDKPAIVACGLSPTHHTSQ